MIVKAKKGKIDFRNISKIHYWLIVIFVTSLLLFFTLYFISGFEYKIIKASKNYVKNARNRTLRLFVAKIISNPKHIDIDIKHTNYLKLGFDRDISLKQGVHLSNSDFEVPANIRYNKKNYKAKIRLKGDWLDHIIGEKWSFKINISGDNTLFGMEEFSIQHPYTRNYIYEWIWHKALKKEDVLALRFDFIDVSVNGKHKGIYALEEHFEKRLLEHNNRREGPILKFNEDLLWKDRARAYVGEPESAFFSSNVEAFGVNKIMTDPTLKKEFLNAFNLLTLYRENKIEVSKVFDIQRLAKLYAISDLFGANHAAIYHNYRFYYNPITSLLEPIAFDGIAGHLIEDLIGNYSKYSNNSFREFEKKLFNDSKFNKLYIS